MDDFAVEGPGGPLTNEEIEAVIGPLIYVGAWLLIDRHGQQAPARLVFLAGVVAGVVAVFKALALLIPLAILVAAMGWSLRNGRGIGTTLRGLVRPFALGFALVAAALVVWVWVRGLGDVVWPTWFQYPFQVPGVEPRPASRLLESSFGFAAVYAPLGLLALFHLVSRRYNQLTLVMAAALGSAVLYVLLQHWWSHHFFVLSLPIAVLALQGLDDLLDAGTRSLVVVASLAILLAVPTALRVGDKAVRLADVVNTGTSLDEYRQGFFSYRTAHADASAVDIEPGEPIYVLGDPLIMYILHADQAIPVSGRSPGAWTDDLWMRVGDDLERNEVETVFLSGFATSLAAERAPWFLQWLNAEYGDPIPGQSGFWLFRTSS